MSPAPQTRRVSVLIPAYRPTYLRQAIASVLAQTFDDYELLISDDSPDGSASEVVAAFRDVRIRLMSGPRRGLVANSAFLWEQARGAYLKYVYDDDFLYPFCISRLVEVMEATPEAVFAFVQRHVVSAEGVIVASPFIRSSEPTKLLPARTAAGLMISRAVNVIGEPSATLIRRAPFADAEALRGYRGLSIRHLIDVAFYLNAFDAGLCVAVAEYHAAFRRYPEQTSESWTSPAFSAGVFEWEAFVRGETAKGRVTLEQAERGFHRLDHVYRLQAPRFPELALFRRGIPEALARLSAGDTDLLDDAFRTAWREANAAIDARLALQP